MDRVCVCVLDGVIVIVGVHIWLCVDERVGVSVALGVGDCDDDWV